MPTKHTFHIPVMGIGFTIDTPLKVAHQGIDSVVSLVDDILIEKMRMFHSKNNNLPYTEIKQSERDHRSLRITSYLNLMNDLVQEKYQELIHYKDEKLEEIKQSISLLPNHKDLVEEFHKLLEKGKSESINDWLKNNLQLGSIDVNIMTKVDKDNYEDGEKLPVEYNDAHAALKGFAESNLQSSLILSAGMNPRLFTYMEQFDDFYPDSEGKIKKKIVLKVSDYRSAMVQGMFLAKKGLWVSEYRIESGLNCGGHAFATEGYLMGPILEEFKTKRHELQESLFAVLQKNLISKERSTPSFALPIQITAQGGVGTAMEHEFLLNHYELNSIGWGTPFLLVPEATNVDETSLGLMENAQEEDLYLSGISPLGIPFNSLRGNTKDAEKQRNIDKNRPGSACPKKFVTLNYEYNKEGLCTASRQFQHLKLKELKEAGLSEEEYQSAFDKIVEKSCTCVGLGTSALLVNNMETKTEGEGVSICPGPNMAYFSKRRSLKEMVSHIYGSTNIMNRTDRPNLFVKEFHIYLGFLKEKMEETKESWNKKQERYFKSFIKNMNSGLEYYESLFEEINGVFDESKEELKQKLSSFKEELAAIEMRLQAEVVA